MEASRRGPRGVYGSLQEGVRRKQLCTPDGSICAHLTESIWLHGNWSLARELLYWIVFLEGVQEKEPV